MTCRITRDRVSKISGRLVDLFLMHKRRSWKRRLRLQYTFHLDGRSIDQFRRLLVLIAVAQWT
jgi:hypothetical protein